MFARVSRSRGAGGGPSVILLHGLGVSGGYLLPTARRLIPWCRVFVPDLPGFGRSARPPQVLAVPELADALTGWMDAVGIREAALVGNSMGCQVAVDCAARYPGRVSRLVLEGPTMDRAARSVPRQLFRLAWAALYEPPSAWLLVLRDYARCGPIRALRTLRLALRDRIEEKLPRVGVPVLIVRGEHDPITPPRWAQELARRCPDEHLAVLPGTAHIPNYSAPDAFVRAILPFLLNDVHLAPAAGVRGEKNAAGASGGH